MEKGRILRLIAAAAVYLWAVCLLGGKDGNLVYLALEDALTPRRALEIFSQEEDPVGCCFWGEDQQEAACPVNGETARVTRVYVAGNTELLGAGALAWQHGCLIDEQTAKALFGADQCGGQVLSWNGEAYPVLAAVPALEPTLVISAREEDELTRCALALPPENGRALGENFLTRFGLRGQVLSFYPLWALARNLLLLAPIVLLTAFYNGQLCHCEPARTLVWQSHKGSEGRMGSFAPLRMTRFLGRMAKRLLPLALLLLLLWKGTVIPPELIPSRWSDFSFWGDACAAQEENLRRILFTPLGGKQLQILLNMVKSMGGSLLAALLLWGAVRRRNHADTSDRGR